MKKNNLDFNKYIPKPGNITIAFLINDLNNEYDIGICHGALKAAGELGISIIFFVVGFLESSNFYSSRMRNKIFSLINPEDYQGIMYISSSISNDIGMEKLLKFVEQYGEIPTAHIGIEVAGKQC